jgi:hypothetical protein
MGALALPGPRHRDEPNPMLLADHPRDRCGEVRPVLEEVQVPPRLLLGALHRTTRPLTLRAREPPCLREVDPQIQPLALRIDACYLPRVAQPKRGLEEDEILRLHPTAPIIDDQKPVRQSAGSDATHHNRGGARSGRCHVHRHGSAITSRVCGCAASWRTVPGPVWSSHSQTTAAVGQREPCMRICVGPVRQRRQVSTGPSRASRLSPDASLSAERRLPYPTPCVSHPAGKRNVANAIAGRAGARAWKRSCGLQQPDARDWAKAGLGPQRRNAKRLLQSERGARGPRCKCEHAASRVHSTQSSVATRCSSAINAPRTRVDHRSWLLSM